MKFFIDPESEMLGSDSESEMLGSESEMLGSDSEVILSEDSFESFETKPKINQRKGSTNCCLEGGLILLFSIFIGIAILNPY